MNETYKTTIKLNIVIGNKRQNISYATTDMTGFEFFNKFD